MMLNFTPLAEKEFEERLTNKMEAMFETFIEHFIGNRSRDNDHVERNSSPSADEQETRRKDQVQKETNCAMSTRKLGLVAY
jgi:hypothetical protein